MRKDTLIFVDREEEYLRSMSEFLGSRKDFPMTIRAYSDVLKMICEEDLSQTEKNDTNPAYTMVLVGESAYMEDLERIAPGKVVILQETENPHPDNICIDKYRSAEKVMKDILRFYADSSAGGGRRPKRREELEIIGFFSPDDIYGKTCLAYAEAVHRAGDNSTLLLDMEMYDTAEALGIRDNETPDMSDLLYFAGEPEEKLRYHLKSMLISFEGCDIVQGMKLGIGLSDIPGEDWITLLEKIAAIDDHEIIVLNLSAGMRGLPKIMGMCDRIMIPGGADNMSSAVAGYLNSLRVLGYEDVLSKISFCRAGNGKATACM